MHLSVLTDKSKWFFSVAWNGEIVLPPGLFPHVCVLNPKNDLWCFQLKGSWPFPLSIAYHSNPGHNSEREWLSRAQWNLITLTCLQESSHWIQWALWIRNHLAGLTRTNVRLIIKNSLNDRVDYLSLFHFSSCDVAFNICIPNQSPANKWPKCLHSFGKQGFLSDVFYTFADVGRTLFFRGGFMVIVFKSSHCTI